MKGQKIGKTRTGSGPHYKLPNDEFVGKDLLIQIGLQVAQGLVKNDQKISGKDIENMTLEDIINALA